MYKIIKTFLKGHDKTRTSLDYYIFILEIKDLINTIYITDLLNIEISTTRNNELKKLNIKIFKIDFRLVIKYFSIEIKRRLDSILLY